MKNRHDVEQAGLEGSCATVGFKCRMLDRFWLIADPDDYGFTPHAVADGYWESWITTWMVRELPGSAFIDVGANQGYYSLLAAHLGCPVIAFEPQRKLVELVLTSSEENGWKERVEVYNTAAGECLDVRTFTVPKHHGMNATFAYEVVAPHGSESFDVAVLPLDFWENWQPSLPLLVKIDAEGAEPMVWSGMQRLFCRSRPTKVLLEFRADRYADPRGFAEELLAKGATSYIDHSGEQVPLDGVDLLLSTPGEDWMVVVEVS